MLGTTGVTAYVGIHDVGRVADGADVLISAASGAVGGTAIQLARAAGAHVVAIAGGKQRTDHAVRVLGAAAAVDTPERLTPIREEMGRLLREKRLRRWSMSSTRPPWNTSSQ